jgi:hypothetical protein
VQTNKRLLTSLIEVVTFLFGAFGGFLKRIAPPDPTNTAYALGISSFFVLINLMVVTAIMRHSCLAYAWKRWLWAGIISFSVAVPAAFLYPDQMEKHTYVPQEGDNVRKINGSPADLTPQARQFVRTNPLESSPSSLEMNLPSNQIWTREGLERTSRKLRMLYVWLVLSLCTAVFCLLEANLSSTLAHSDQKRAGG